MVKTEQDPVNAAQSLDLSKEPASKPLFSLDALIAFFTTKDGVKLFTQLKNRIDTDGDGKISSNEFIAFLRSDVVKFTIISIFAMVFEEFVNWVIHWFTTGEFTYTPFSNLLKSFGGYLVLMVWFKSWMDTNNKDKLKLKTQLDVSNGIILSHAAEINKLNDKHDRMMENLRHEKEVEIAQRDAAIQTKDLEISWLRKGFDPQKIQAYMELEQARQAHQLIKETDNRPTKPLETNDSSELPPES
jgi:hypothetical protein